MRTTNFAHYRTSVIFEKPLHFHTQLTPCYLFWHVSFDDVVVVFCCWIVDHGVAVVGCQQAYDREQQGPFLPPGNNSVVQYPENRDSPTTMPPLARGPPFREMQNNITNTNFSNNVADINKTMLLPFESQVVANSFNARGIAITEEVPRQCNPEDPRIREAHAKQHLRTTNRVPAHFAHERFSGSNYRNIRDHHPAFKNNWQRPQRVLESPQNSTAVEQPPEQFPDNNSTVSELENDEEAMSRASSGTNRKRKSSDPRDAARSRVNKPADDEIQIIDPDNGSVRIYKGQEGITEMAAELAEAKTQLEVLKKNKKVDKSDGELTRIKKVFRERVWRTHKFTSNIPITNELVEAAYDCAHLKPEGPGFEEISEWPTRKKASHKATWMNTCRGSVITIANTDRSNKQGQLRVSLFNFLSLMDKPNQKVVEEAILIAVATRNITLVDVPDPKDNSKTIKGIDVDTRLGMFAVHYYGDTVSK